MKCRGRSVNQLLVKSTLRTTSDDHIFAMGDCAFYMPEGVERKLLICKRSFLEKALKVHIKNKILPKFEFRGKGS